MKNPIRDLLYISECGFPLSSDFYVRTHAHVNFTRVNNRQCREGLRRRNEVEPRSTFTFTRDT